MEELRESHLNETVFQVRFTIESNCDLRNELTFLNHGIIGEFTVELRQRIIPWWQENVGTGTMLRALSLLGCLVREEHIPSLSPRPLFLVLFIVFQIDAELLENCLLLILILEHSIVIAGLTEQSEARPGIT